MFPFSIGLTLGFAISIALFLAWKRIDTRERDNYRRDLEQSFSTLSRQALSQNLESFLAIAGEKLTQQSTQQTQHLDSKKTLIDQTLVTMKQELTRVQDMVRVLEKDREQKFGELSNYLKLSHQQTLQLANQTRQLHQALANSKTRGQWGERMAEDVLRLSGLLEGVNYVKQKATTYSRSIPDFTFFLPHQHIVNMDVKFPLTNYLAYLEATTDEEQQRFKLQFLRDVRQQIRDVAAKDYVNPEAKTADYVLVFIPNEQVYSFINETDRNIMDEALKSKVIFCSPMTLYAILVVMRQAIDHFAFQETTSTMIALFGNFYKQWKTFNEVLEKMGEKISDAQKHFGVLMTTRKNQLEKPLEKIEALRQEKKIALIEDSNP